MEREKKKWEKAILATGNHKTRAQRPLEIAAFWPTSLRYPPRKKGTEREREREREREMVGNTPV